jgi:16S rRNA (cytidine1402-2'-O)-methyltransferase
LTTRPLPPALYLVATPIGNLDDISARGLEVLRQADVIACEDTRHSKVVLDRAGATGRRVALHDHNEDAEADGLLDHVAGGRAVALVSDAGTPLVSDPGFPVVRRAVARGITVTSIPGPCAAVAALTVSGLSTARFHFVGFLPDRPSRREALLAEVADLAATLVFYVPPRELPEVLGLLERALGDRPAAVCRELTKLHEETRRGVLSALRASPPVALGEAVVVVAGAPEVANDPALLDEAIARGLAAGEQASTLAKRLAREHRLSRGAVYQRLLALKG